MVRRSLLHRVLCFFTAWAILHTLFSNSSLANPNCVALALEKNQKHYLDSSVELELDLTDEVLDLLTTTDGTIGGLDLDGIPIPFNRWIKKRGTLERSENLLWDDLPNDMKKVLIEAAVRHSDISFYPGGNRTIYGLKVKDTVSLRFSHRTNFLGTSYPSGRHQVDISSVLSGPIHVRSPKDLKKVSGIELHFRSDKSAGTVSNQAWAFLKGASIPRNHQHIHIVAPIPARSIQNQPRFYPALMGDFYRRTNLASEMLGIVFNGGSIRTKKIGISTYFDSLSKSQLKEVTQYFEEFGKLDLKIPAIGDKYKTAWVGFRGVDKYDQPGLWGLEYRAIPAHADTKQTKIVLDAIQEAMVSRSFGWSGPESLDRFQRWFLSHPHKKSVGDIVADAYYNQGWDQLFRRAPSKVKLLGSWIISPFKGRRNREIKMLFHNWANDPLVFENPSLQKQITDAQIMALKKLQINRNPNRVVKEFLVDSGLFREVLQSIGVNPDEIITPRIRNHR